MRALAENNEIKVRVFDDGNPATDVSYSVTIETAFDAQTRGFPIDLVDGLMDLAEKDVTEGRVGLSDQPSN